MRLPSINDIIAFQREKKGVSQKDMARNIGISESYMFQIENGSRKPSNRLLTEIVKYFDAPLSALIFESLKEKDKKTFIKAQPMIEQMLTIILK